MIGRFLRDAAGPGKEVPVVALWVGRRPSPAHLRCRSKPGLILDPGGVSRILCDEFRPRDHKAGETWKSPQQPSSAGSSNSGFAKRCDVLTGETSQAQALWPDVGRLDVVVRDPRL